MNNELFIILSLLFPGSAVASEEVDHFSPEEHAAIERLEEERMDAHSEAFAKCLWGMIVDNGLVDVSAYQFLYRDAPTEQWEEWYEFANDAGIYWCGDELPEYGWIDYNHGSILSALKREGLRVCETAKDEDRMCELVLMMENED